MARDTLFKEKPMRDLLVAVRGLFALAGLALLLDRSLWPAVPLLLLPALCLPRPPRDRPDPPRGLDALRRTERSPAEREPAPRRGEPDA